MRTSNNGIQVIKEFEGCKLKAYQDIVGVWTIGYGFTKDVRPNDMMTQTECEERLVEELAVYEQAVHEATGGKYTQNQFDAMVSLAWNIGVSGLRKSSVIKAHNRVDYQAAARAFSLWNKAGGKVVPGLTRRRAAESVLYLTPEVYEPQLDMPQRVDEERPMTSSTINRAGVIAGGTATVAGVSQTIDMVTNLKYSITSLGNWLVPALLVLTVVSVGYIIYERVMQRKNGWV